MRAVDRLVRRNLAVLCSSLIPVRSSTVQSDGRHPRSGDKRSPGDETVTLAVLWIDLSIPFCKQGHILPTGVII